MGVSASASAAERMLHPGLSVDAQKACRHVRTSQLSMHI